MHGFALAAASLVCLAGALLTPAPPPRIVAPAVEAGDIAHLAMGVPSSPKMPVRLG